MTNPGELFRRLAAEVMAEDPRILESSSCLKSGTPSVNTKAAAEEAERQHIARALAVAEVPQRKEVPAFGDFAETFMRTYARRNKPSEQAAKRWILDRRLLPKFANVTLDRIGRLEGRELQERPPG